MRQGRCADPPPRATPQGRGKSLCFLFPYILTLRWGRRGRRGGEGGRVKDDRVPEERREAARLEGRGA
jgi:hypothetical protein